MSKLDRKLIINTLIDILEEMLNYLKGDIKYIKTRDFAKLRLTKCNFTIDFEYFDNDERFYDMIFNLCDEAFESEIVYLTGLDSLKQKCGNLFSLFIKYIIKILQNDKEAYSNFLLKINIFFIFSYLKNDSGKDFVEDKTYYFLAINELQKEYKDQDIWNELIKIYHNIYYDFKIKTLRDLAKLKLPDKYKDNPHLIEVQQNLLEHFQNEIIENNNIDEYILNFNEYITIQIESLLIKLNKEKNAKDFKDLIFNLKDINEIVTLLTDYEKNRKNIPEIINYFYENNYKLMNDFREIIEKIINSEEFYDKLKKIIKSKSIILFLDVKRNFKGNYNTVETDSNECDINLKKTFNDFNEKLINNRERFVNLIKIKDFPKEKRALVNETLKILINPLFIQVVNGPNSYLESEDFRKIIFSYLIIIIILEIVQLLKFIKYNQEKEVNKTFLEKKTELKENKEVKAFMKYLFQNNINQINIIQAKKILDIENWENINRLREIFEESKKVNNIDEQVLSIKYYTYDYVNRQNNSKGWIDIN